MPNLTWLGDSDPGSQTVEVFGHTFVRGEPLDLGQSDPALAKLSTNPLFSTEPDAEPADLPNEDERTALKAELRSRGEEVKGNPSLDTLRDRLAKLAAK